MTTTNNATPSADPWWYSVGPVDPRSNLFPLSRTIQGSLLPDLKVPSSLFGYSIDNLQSTTLPVPLSEIPSTVSTYQLTAGSNNWLGMPVGVIRLFFSKNEWMAQTLLSHTTAYLTYVQTWVREIANQSFATSHSGKDLLPNHSPPIFVLSSDVPFSQTDFTAVSNAKTNPFQVLYQVVQNNDYYKKGGQWIQLWYDLGTVTSRTSTPPNSDSATTLLTILSPPPTLSSFMDGTVLRIVSSTMPPPYLITNLPLSPTLFVKTIWGIEQQDLLTTTSTTFSTLQQYSPVLTMSTTPYSSTAYLPSSLTSPLLFQNILLSSVSLSSKYSATTTFTSSPYSQPVVTYRRSPLLSSQSWSPQLTAYTTYLLSFVKQNTSSNTGTLGTWGTHRSDDHHSNHPFSPAYSPSMVANPNLLYQNVHVHDMIPTYFPQSLESLPPWHHSSPKNSFLSPTTHHHTAATTTNNGSPPINTTTTSSQTTTTTTATTAQSTTIPNGTPTASSLPFSSPPKMIFYSPVMNSVANPPFSSNTEVQQGPWYLPLVLFLLIVLILLGKLLFHNKQHILGDDGVWTSFLQKDGQEIWVPSLVVVMSLVSMVLLLCVFLSPKEYGLSAVPTSPIGPFFYSFCMILLVVLLLRLPRSFSGVNIPLVFYWLVTVIVVIGMFLSSLVSLVFPFRHPLVPDAARTNIPYHRLMIMWILLNVVSFPLFGWILFQFLSFSSILSLHRKHLLFGLSVLAFVLSAFILSCFVVYPSSISSTTVSSSIPTGSVLSSSPSSLPVPVSIASTTTGSNGVEDTPFPSSPEVPPPTVPLPTAVTNTITTYPSSSVPFYPSPTLSSSVIINNPSTTAVLGSGATTTPSSSAPSSYPLTTTTTTTGNNNTTTTNNNNTVVSPGQASVLPVSSSGPQSPSIVTNPSTPTTTLSGSQIGCLVVFLVLFMISAVFYYKVRKDKEDPSRTNYIRIISICTISSILTIYITWISTTKGLEGWKIGWGVLLLSYVLLFLLSKLSQSRFPFLKSILFEGERPVNTLLFLCVMSILLVFLP